MKRFAAVCIIGFGLAAALAACGDIFSPTTSYDYRVGQNPTPTPSVTPTPTPVPCFPAGAPCVVNTDCCALSCLGGLCQ